MSDEPMKMTCSVPIESMTVEQLKELREQAQNNIDLLARAHAAEKRSLCNIEGALVRSGEMIQISIGRY